jgi:tetratricopeptide (TPR) repeat protein
MEFSEEKQLKRITEEFTEGITVFRKHELAQALEIFSRICEEFDDSQYYSVVEIHSRSLLYKALCDSRLNPVKILNREDEDFLYDGIFHLNARSLDKALEDFKYLEEKKYDDPYLNYLLSLVYLKKGDNDTCLLYLRKAVDADDYYKVIAYNEPDYESLFENDKFTEIVELGAEGFRM